MMLTYPLLTQQLVNQLGQGQAIGSLGWQLVSVLGIGILFGAASGILLARVAQSVSAALRHLLLSKMLGLPVTFFAATDTGERVSRVVNDCESISNLTTNRAIDMINGLLMLVGSLIILILLDAQLTLVLFCTLLIAFALSAPAVMRMELLGKDLQERTANLSGFLTHIFSEIRLIKAFVAEPREHKRAHVLVDGLKEQSFRMARLNIVMQTVAGLAVMAALTVILVYGGVRVGRGDLSMGVMTAFILYIFNVVGPLSQVGAFVSELQIAKGASARLTSILHEQDEQATASSIIPFRNRTLEFNQVRFRYPGNDIHV